jgi:hypothetical protein
MNVYRHPSKGWGCRPSVVLFIDSATALSLISKRLDGDARNGLGYGSNGIAGRDAEQDVRGSEVRLGFCGTLLTGNALSS